MKTIRPVFLSSYPPEQCRLATFTMDSADAVDQAAGRPISSVIAIEKTHSLTDTGCRVASRTSGRVAHVIENDLFGAYRRAASVVNDGKWNIVNLQHEFGLYPGDLGGEIMEFVRHCKDRSSVSFTRYRCCLILFPGSSRQSHVGLIDK